MKKILPLLVFCFLANVMVAQGEEEEAFVIVDEMPMFPGCEMQAVEAKELRACAERKMLEFIYQNITYPEVAREEGIEGTVVIRFVVEKDGSIANTEILRNIGGGCGEAALKVVQMMNDMPQKWTPGKKDGEAVRVQFNLPVRFKLEEESEDEGQNLFSYFIFCRDFVGEFFQKDFLLSLAETEFDTQNLCEEGIQLRKIKISYEKEGQDIITVEGETWTPEIRAIFKNADSGGAFSLDYTLGKDDLELEVTKVLMVE